jgi:hypothetical protein
VRFRFVSEGGAANSFQAPDWLEPIAANSSISGRALPQWCCKLRKLTGVGRRGSLFPLFIRTPNIAK